MELQSEQGMYVDLKKLHDARVQGTAISEGDIKQLYDKHAQNYEQAVGNNGYVAPSNATDVLHKIHGPGKANIKILDVGCGTGLVGEHLRDLGYTNVDGLDLSQEMLDIAIKKGVYKKTYCDFLAKDHKLPILDGEYDSVICVGTISPTHVKADACDEFARLVKPGGIVCFNIRNLFMSVQTLATFQRWLKWWTTVNGN